MPTPHGTPPTQAQLQAADQYVQIAVKALKNEKGLAGTFVFRSFAFRGLEDRADAVERRGTQAVVQVLAVEVIAKPRPDVRAAAAK